MTLANYQASLNSVIRAWALDLVTDSQVQDMLYSVVGRNLTQAWNEGAAECNIKPDELSGTEQLRRTQELFTRLTRIPYLVEFLAQVRAAQPEGRMEGQIIPPQVENRLSLWINDYRAIRDIAAAMACADKKKTWILGGTKEHCKTCLGLAGRTYRYSTWEYNDALPRSRNLECSGFRCDCRLEDTGARITPGRFPRSLLIY